MTNPETPAPARRLSEDLRALLVAARGRAITVEQIERILRGRGVAMLILVLAAPFLVPAPGLSVPFGIAICLLGLRIAIGGRSALPRFILQREISFQVLERIVRGVAGAVEKIEKRIRPRMRFLQEHPRMVNLIGVGIVSGGFILSLPLPIPLSNTLPALSILSLAAGLMERDGLLVLWGYVMGVVSWIYIGFWWGAFVATLRWVWHFLF